MNAAGQRRPQRRPHGTPRIWRAVLLADVLAASLVQRAVGDQASCAAALQPDGADAPRPAAALGVAVTSSLAADLRDGAPHGVDLAQRSSEALRKHRLALSQQRQQREQGARDGPWEIGFAVEAAAHVAKRRKEAEATKPVTEVGGGGASGGAAAGGQAAEAKQTSTALGGAGAGGGTAAGGPQPAAPPSRPRPICVRNAGDCSKGAASVEMAPSSHCECSESTCAGADGECYPEPSTVVASGFRLRNVRWPDLQMYVSAKTLVVTRNNFTQNREFVLHALSGQGENPEAFVLGSESYPDAVATVSVNWDCAPDVVCFKEVNARTSYVSGGATSAAGLALRLVRAPGVEGAPDGMRAVMISGYQVPDHFLYIGQLDWSLSVAKNDPGTGGYWIPEPPLPIELPAYEGPLCSWDCGGYDTGQGIGGMARGFLLFTSAFIIAATLISQEARIK